MTQGIIYMVDGQGLKRMTPSAPENEDRMQELVALYPELITDGDGDLLLIRRELPIGDGLADSRWSLDHLFVTQDGVPVLVELKRASDPRARREVVAPMLDYAANATAYWKPGTIASEFAVTAGEDAEAMLSVFLRGRDPEKFWEQVDNSFKAGRIKMVFVADEIPRELARIVEFLNEQMKADVRAVELRWFTGEGGVTTLSPRVIGETERAIASKAVGMAVSPLTPDDWLAEKIEPLGQQVLAGCNRFIELVHAEGGEAIVPQSGGSIMSRFAADSGAKFWPMSLSPRGLVRLSLCYLLYRPAFASDAARQQLYDSLVSIVGDLHTQNLRGEPGFSAALLCDPKINESVEGLLHGIVSAGRKEA